MVHYLYHFEYNPILQRPYTPGHREASATDGEGDGTDVDEPATDLLVTHAKVYALAEKYLIHGLKAVALRQFKAVAASIFRLDLDDFLEAASEVYTSTVEDDRGLRDIVVETLYKHPFWLDVEKVRDTLKGLGGLTYDLVIYMRQHGNI